ncbi:GNAT family N-acetyltransferase [Kitasatospora sp. NPDC093679]|uniref:bifunctional acetate--CoA ligase family protein/GNAT family N-acetyltransferase n=1 Tax=Kitasatospora sp. NPDC093679 TaxID=3154983 RepID=UPI0034357965
MSVTEPPVSAAEALLADGTTVLVRPVGAADRAAVLDLHEHGMSDESRRMRFLGTSRRSAATVADRLCGPGRAEVLALGAWADGELVGEADCEATGPGGSAELAMAVADAWHHRGVGTLLVEHLVHAARKRGIHEFVADTLAGNRAVHKVFSDLGLPVHRHLDHGEIRVRVPLDEDDEGYLRAVEERGRTADLASLAALLRPRSVAVVGASRRAGSVGRTVLLKLRRGGFTGPVWAVNPHTGVIAGEPAYPGIAVLPGAPELAVLAVPAAAVPGAAEECGRAGTKALVVLASGVDAAQTRQLVDSCRRHSMRLVGPNSLGIVQTDPGVRLDAEFGGAFPLPGTAGVAVQSGGVGIALLERLAWLGIGVSTFVSLGDKCDVSGNDMLQWWESDGRTDLALLHLESFGSPRAFARTARRVTRTLPVLTVDAGRSDAGRRGAASHTAAAATPTVTRETLFRLAGITAAHSIAELVGAAALLHAQPLPDGRGRVAVVSNAGGIGILAADACAEAGLELPPLPADTVAELRGLLPAGAGTANPVDTTADVDPAVLRACLDALVRAETVDALLVCLVPTALVQHDADRPLHALLDGPGRRQLPVAAVLLDQEVPVRYRTCADGGLLPSYTDPAAAARALAHARDRARWLAEPPSAPAAPPAADTAGARGLVDAYLAARPDGGWLDPETTTDLLGRYRLPLATAVLARTEDEAADAARQLGPLGHEGRLAAKAYWPDQVHKSAEGAVSLGIVGETRARECYREFQDRFGDRTTGVVFQPMAAPGLELLVGAVQDEVFGPLVLLGLGGTATDVLGDRTTRFAPLTERDLETMPADLRAAPLLLGRPGAPGADPEGLRGVLTAVSALACDLPQVVEVDLNPLIARPDGVVCVDARVRVEPRPSFDPYLRRLRGPARAGETAAPGGTGEA